LHLFEKGGAEMLRSFVLSSLVCIQVLAFSGNLFEPDPSKLKGKEPNEAKAAKAGTVHVVMINGNNDVTDSVSQTGTSQLNYNGDNGNSDSINWENHTGSTYYVCIPGSTNQPFQANVWFVPNDTSKASGQINDGSLFNGPYNVYSNPQACVDFSAKNKTKGRGNPVIIIQH
jgi:hypothetical protein